MSELGIRGGSAIRWGPLALYVALTTILSLSCHVVMLDVMGIPHPTIDQVAMSARIIDAVLSVAATLVFYRVARSRFERLPIVLRWLLLTAIYAMLNQALLRRFIMEGVVSHDWLYCFVKDLPGPLEYAITSGLIVVAATRLRSAWSVIAGALGIAVLAFVIAAPIDFVFDKLTASIEYLDTGNIYNPPYGWQVNVPSYLTFLEPVVASYLIAALALDRLSTRPLLRLAQFAGLVMAMSHSIVPTLLYSFYQPLPLASAMLSESQFALETLVMGVLTAIGWRWAGGRSGR